MDIHVIVKLKNTRVRRKFSKFYLNNLQVSNVLTDTTVILKEKILNEKST